LQSMRLPSWASTKQFPELVARAATVALLLVLALFTVVPTLTEESSALSVFTTSDIYQPVVTWASGTPHNSVFLVSDAYTWNWLISRPMVVMGSNMTNNLQNVLRAINQYKVNYLEVDSVNSPQLAYQILSLSDIGRFSLSFESSVRGFTIWIYNVTGISQSDQQLGVMIAALTEDAEIYSGTPNETVVAPTLSVGWAADHSESEVLMKFAFVGLPGNVHVLGGELEVVVSYSYSSENATEPLVIGYSLTSPDWQKNNVTWSNQPTVVTAGSSNVSLGSNYNGPVTFELKVSSMVGNSLSLILFPLSYSGFFRYSAIASYSGATDSSIQSPASLVVLYTEP
jgi:hypothetical protein